MSNVINFQAAKLENDFKKEFGISLEEGKKIAEDLLKKIEEKKQQWLAEQRKSIPEDKFKGQKYKATERLDIKEVAKRVRADIKSAIKRGVLPNMKTSVRISRYSMGQSLDVTITSFDKDVLTEEYRANKGDWEYMRENEVQRYIPEVNQALETLREIVKAYNRDNSDSQTDYFDVKFYSDVAVSYKLEK